MQWNTIFTLYMGGHMSYKRLSTTGRGGTIINSIVQTFEFLSVNVKVNKRSFVFFYISNIRSNKMHVEPPCLLIKYYQVPF